MIRNLGSFHAQEWGGDGTEPGAVKCVMPNRAVARSLLDRGAVAQKLDGDRGCWKVGLQLQRWQHVQVMQWQQHCSRVCLVVLCARRA